LGPRFKDFELIVVDDGSTEETRQLLASYGSRLRCLYQDNLGPSAARNVGARHAQGAWRAFQDPDHLSAPNHLELLYRHAQEGSDFAMVLANGKYLGGSEHSRARSFRRRDTGRWPLGAWLWEIFSTKASSACRRA
jgi:glycosyltransferase involved in cell wall biosynthesis